MNKKNTALSFLYYPIHKKALTLLCLLGRIIGSYTYAQPIEQQTINIQDFITKQQSYQPADPTTDVFKQNHTNTNYLIQNFCASVLDTTNNKHLYFNSPGTAQSVYFDATQSAFLYVLCSPAGFTNTFHPQFTGDDTILQKQHRSDYGIDCNPSDNINTCNFHRQVHKIILELLNDIGNIKTASSYGITHFEKTSTTEQKKQLTLMSNQFGQRYFGAPVVLCDPENDTDNTCTYPKTLNHLKEFLRNADTIAKKNTTFYLQNISLQLQAQNNKNASVHHTCIKEFQGTKDQQYNIYTCGLLGHKLTQTSRREPASLQDTTTLIYNELRRYKNFVTLYAHSLSNNPQLQPYTTTANTSQLIQEAQHDANNMLLINKTIEKTAEDMIQQLSHIQFKFPIHIGLMMYYERLRDMRQELVKTYTPLHQLYYKLRNVQQAK